MKPNPQAISGQASQNRPWATAGNNSLGFTLIEILMVMGIFCIGILAILALHITAINSNAKARATMTGSILLADQFEKLISADYRQLENISQEASATNAGGFLTQHTVSATAIPNIKKIDLTITLPGAAGRHFAVTYYKRNPE